MTSILNKTIGLSHRVNPADITSVSERLIIRPGDGNDKKTIFGGEHLPCITTSYTLTTGDNVQFTPTLGTELYAYVLGNNPYVLTVQGCIFNDDKNESSKPIKRSLTSFNRYRAAANTTVRVCIGEVTFRALLESIAITGSAEQGSDIFTFKLTLRGVLDNK